MSSKAIESHIPCPCGKSSDAYTVYDDGHGFCYSCNKAFNTGNQLKELKEIYHDGFRGIPAEVCEKLGILSLVDDSGEVIYRKYVYPEGIQLRRVKDKKFSVQGKLPPLGGMNLFNAGCSHYITIVEGAEDAAAAYYMLNNGKKTIQPVVWLISASIPNKHKKAIYDYLSSFETVKVAIEDDEAGRRVKQTLSEMLPNKIKEVLLTKHKDANDYLIHGDEREFKQAWANAKVYTPDNIYHTEKDIDNIINDLDNEFYIPTPWENLNELIKGIPKNHVTLLTGLEGIGKTEILRALEANVLKKGIPIAVLHHEETKKTLLKGLACYQTGKSFRDPDNPPDPKELKQAIKELTDNYSNLFIFEFKNDPDVSTILEQMNYLVHVCGVEYIFIDPINQFDPIDDTPKVEFLDSLSKRVEKFVTTHPVGVIWTAHVDDEGRTRNSRMISKAASIRIDLKRDILAESETERNRTYVYVSKNRPFGRTGYAGFIEFDPETFTVLGKENESPTGVTPLPF